ncbi:protein of unknown function [Ralstonia solanacearum CMR15]|nr:protein of unknown function [Ralstonia solanacearum CMR15]
MAGWSGTPKKDDTQMGVSEKCNDPENQCASGIFSAPH